MPVSVAAQLACCKGARRRGDGRGGRPTISGRRLRDRSAAGNAVRPLQNLYRRASLPELAETSRCMGQRTRPLGFQRHRPETSHQREVHHAFGRYPSGRGRLQRRREAGDDRAGHRGDGGRRGRGLRPPAFGPILSESCAASLAPDQKRAPVEPHATQQAAARLRRPVRPRTTTTPESARSQMPGLPPM